MFSRVLPGDESWVRHVSRIQNRIHAVEKFQFTITRNFKPVPLAGNVVFLRGTEGVLLLHFQKPLETISTTSNCTVLLTLWGPVCRKRPGLLRRGLWLVQDDVRCFAALALRELK